MPVFEIDIPTELAELLTVEAGRRGLAVDALVTQAIRDAVAFSGSSGAPAAKGAADAAFAATPQERTLARIFARRYVGPNLPIGLGSLILDWARAKGAEDDLGPVLLSYQEKGWLRRAGEQDVILTDAGYAAIQRI